MTPIENVSDQNCRLKTVIFCFLIILAGCIAYGNSLSNGFTYDDTSVLVSNHYIKDIRNLPRLFTSDYFLVSRERTFRPIAPLTLFIEYALLQLNPAPYHALSIFLHILNALLLFWVMIKLALPRWSALVAGLCFVCHPVISETVLNMSYMEDLWGLFFFLIALLSVIFFCDTGRKRFAVLVQVCYFLSLLSKEMGITLPLVVLICGFVFPQRMPLRSTIYFGILLPSCITAVLYGYLRFFLFFSSDRPADYPGGSILVTILNIPRILFHYIKLFLYPATLIADYQFDVYANPFRLAVWIPWCLLGGLVFLIWKLPRILSFWLVMYLLHFIPVSNIIPFGAVIGERYMYFSAIGFAGFAGCCFTVILENDWKYRDYITIIFITVMALTFYIARDMVRAADWKDDNTLWTATYRSAPAEMTRKVTFHVNLGNVYFERGDLDNALKEYMVAKKIKPDSPGVMNNIGIIYTEKKYYDLAKSTFLTSIAKYPEFLDTYYSLADLYITTRSFDEAEQVLRRIIAIDKNEIHAYFRLGLLAMQESKFSDAIDRFKDVLRFSASHTGAYINMSVCYIYMDKKDLAEAVLREGIKNGGDAVELYIRLSELYMRDKRYKDAFSCGEYLIKEFPKRAEGYTLAASVYHSTGKLPQARIWYEKALSIAPDNTHIINNLAAVDAALGDLDTARSLWRDSLRLDPNQPHIQKQLQD
ncbi:MAG: tetratricopeptide repeat protein [Candidatus Auribacter fodinae]|jgi:tetratricopeptide (TPR) repeat protein|uniref:Tetratricopeptide repeat protein n=1 Tax=Candidatus Auribacter fodinae TaxID=2093366 RepID=A0A3A4R4I7_9BACT|nr:MAG: tetratricopeptide repeat protein [Candidatus Auribacter fodinae]